MSVGIEPNLGDRNKQELEQKESGNTDNEIETIYTDCKLRKILPPTRCKYMNKMWEIDPLE